MPDVNEYIDGYKLHKGLRFGGYELSNFTVQHNTEVLWNEYSYPAVITMKWVGDGKASEEAMNNMFDIFTDYINGIRIIYTASGRSYKCLFQWPVDKSPDANVSPDYTTIDISYVGFAKRIGKKEAGLIKSGKKNW
jgi:hypothetical protein